jgi:hypothetical protein
LLAKYGTAVNPPSATETLDGREAAAAAEQRKKDEEDRWGDEIKGHARRERSPRTRTTSRSQRQTPMEKAAGEAGRTLAREIIKNIFRRRR